MSHEQKDVVFLVEFDQEYSERPFADKIEGKEGCFGCDSHRFL